MKTHERVAARFRLMRAMSLEQAKAILGFPPNETPSDAEIERRRRQKAVEHHPDKGGDPDKMVEVNVAADVLSGKARATGSPSRYDTDEPSGPAYRPEPRPQPKPVRITWEEAEASANVPSAEWKFKTQSAFSGYGDTSAVGFVLVGQMGVDQWAFVAVEHFKTQNAFTGEDVDEYWMKAQTASGALRDVAPKFIRQMFKFPHVSKSFNAKVEILPDGTRLSKDLLFTSGRAVSFKDAMEILGALPDDDPWKNRKLQIAMLLTQKGFGVDGEKQITLIINGREHLLRRESTEFIIEKTKVLHSIFGTYYYFSNDKKLLTKSKNGKKVMEFLAEKLTHEPQTLRDALAAAAAQM